MTETELLRRKLFAEFDPRKNTLSDLAHRLLDDQKKGWARLYQGYASLGSVMDREIACDGFIVKLQWNPQRHVSTSAKVDEKSIRERKCFLCLENLPEEQKGILYNDEFLVLCNPAPIFRTHYTISHVKHIPQSIEPAINSMLDLAKDLSPALSVFYNGPKCGASAPDHLHFQASPRNAIPVELDAVDARRRTMLRKSPSIAVLGMKHYGRSLVVIESTDQIDLTDFLKNIFSLWKKVAGTSEEPMMNLICTYREMVWRVILFLRSKHRPEIYFQEGDSRVLISPAAVDMGGLVITPVERDFHRVDREMIETILSEVSFPGEQVDEIIKHL